MAISCLAMPLAGRPTRRMRCNSASVASGMSEKSICESGIGLTFFSTRLPCADDPDGFFFTVRLRIVFTTKRIRPDSDRPMR